MHYKLGTRLTKALFLGQNRGQAQKNNPKITNQPQNQTIRGYNYRTYNQN